MSARISIIAAVVTTVIKKKGKKSKSLKIMQKKTSVIGHDNAIPWYIPEDLKHFKHLTMDHPVIMGRKTYDSIGRPLPKRFNIVITRNSELKIDGCTTVGSLTEAVEIAKAKDKDEIFIIGGAQIYEQAMPIADQIYFTEIKTDGIVKGDALFPEITSEWQEVTRSEIYKKLGLSSGSGNIDYCFITYERTSRSG